MVQFGARLLALLSFIGVVAAFAPVHPAARTARRRPSVNTLVRRSWLIAPPDPCERTSDEGDIVAFTGGGLFYWWQAGYMSAFRLPPNARVVGASAGSLTALMAKCDVDQEEAFRLALDLCDKYEIFSRPLGLAGRWGGLVREWINALLPMDAHERCRGKVHVLITHIAIDPFAPEGSPQKLSWPLLKRVRVTDFRDRADLVDCVMASVHIPWFMDGTIAATFRGQNFVDGSFLQRDGELTVPLLVPVCGCEENGFPDVTVDHKYDASLEDGTAFLQLKPGPELVRALMSRGKAFAARQHGELREPSSL